EPRHLGTWTMLAILQIGNRRDVCGELLPLWAGGVRIELRGKGFRDAITARQRAELDPVDDAFAEVDHDTLSVDHQRVRVEVLAPDLNAVPTLKVFAEGAGGQRGLGPCVLRLHHDDLRAACG